MKYKFNSLIVTLGTSSICSGILFGTFEAGRTELPKKLYALSKINLVTVTIQNPVLVLHFRLRLLS